MEIAYFNVRCRTFAWAACCPSEARRLLQLLRASERSPCRLTQYGPGDSRPQGATPGGAREAPSRPSRRPCSSRTTATIGPRIRRQCRPAARLAVGVWLGNELDERHYAPARCCPLPVD